MRALLLVSLIVKKLTLKSECSRVLHDSSLTSEFNGRLLGLSRESGNKYTRFLVVNKDCFVLVKSITETTYTNLCIVRFMYM